MATPNREPDYIFGQPLTTPDLLEDELLTCDSARQYVNELIARYFQSDSEVVLRTVSSSRERLTAKQFYRGGIIGIRAVEHELGSKFAASLLGETIPIAPMNGDLSPEDKLDLVQYSLDTMGRAGLSAEPE